MHKEKDYFFLGWREVFFGFPESTKQKGTFVLLYILLVFVCVCESLIKQRLSLPLLQP